MCVSCLAPFSIKAFDRIRKTIGMLEAEGEGDRRCTRTSWKFLERSVCVSAWKRLHALGALLRQSQRFIVLLEKK